MLHARIRSTRLLLPLAVLSLGIAAAFPPAPAAAQPAPKSNPGSLGIPQPEPLVTVNLNQVSIARALSELFKQTSYRYQIVAEQGTTRYTLSAEKQPLTKVLTAILDQDKRADPLVFHFMPRDNMFTIVREYITLNAVEGENRVGLTNARITRVLPELFKLMGNAKYRIEPDVPAILVTMQARPMQWADALPQIIVDANNKEPALTFSIDNDSYVVHLQKTPIGLSPTGSILPDAGRLVSMIKSDMDLRQAINQLFAGSQWKAQISPLIPNLKVNVNATQQPELVVLRQILRSAAIQGNSLTYREGMGTLYIEPGYLPGEPYRGNIRPAPAKTVSMTAVQQPLKEVVRTISDRSGTTILVDAAVTDVALSVQLANAPIDEALQKLVEAARSRLPQLRYRQSNGTYTLYTQ
jgi:type II secretory pathway component GspD/PulD (secretin)